MILAHFSSKKEKEEHEKPVTVGQNGNEFRFLITACCNSVCLQSSRFLFLVGSHLCIHSLPVSFHSAPLCRFLHFLFATASFPLLSLQS